MKDKNSTFISTPPGTRESECKAIATQPPQAKLTQHLKVRSRPAIGRCLDVRTGSGVRRTKRVVELLRVTSIFFDRRPVWAHRQRRRREFGEFVAGIDDLPTHDCKYRFEMLDLLFGNGKIVARENRQVGQLARSKRSFFAVFGRKPAAPHRVELERFLTIQSVLLRIKTETPDGLAGDKPVEGKVRVVARNPGRVSSGADRDTHFQHATDRRRAFGLL